MVDLVVIDNYDSFTYNLVAYCQELGANTQVFYNDQITIKELKQLNPQKILLSPGPGNTKDSGVTLDIIKDFHQTTPILGVCLGHQCLVEFFGCKIIHADRIMHGKTSIVTHDDSKLFKNIKNNFTVCRYHSLIVDYESIVNNKYLDVTAFSQYDSKKEVMAFGHNSLPIYGVQFHPEAVLSEYGHQLLNNFLNI